MVLCKVKFVPLLVLRNPLLVGSAVNQAILVVLVKCAQALVIRYVKLVYLRRFPVSVRVVRLVARRCPFVLPSMDKLVLWDPRVRAICPRFLLLSSNALVKGNDVVRNQALALHLLLLVQYQYLHLSV